MSQYKKMYGERVKPSAKAHDAENRALSNEEKPDGKRLFGKRGDILQVYFAGECFGGTLMQIDEERQVYAVRFDDARLLKQKFKNDKRYPKYGKVLEDIAAEDAQPITLETLRNYLGMHLKSSLFLLKTKAATRRKGNRLSEERKTENMELVAKLKEESELYVQRSLAGLPPEEFSYTKGRDAAIDELQWSDSESELEDELIAGHDGDFSGGCEKELRTGDICMCQLKGWRRPYCGSVVGFSESGNVNVAFDDWEMGIEQGWHSSRKTRIIENIERQLVLAVGEERRKRYVYMKEIKRIADKRRLRLFAAKKAKPQNPETDTSPEKEDESFGERQERLKKRHIAKFLRVIQQGKTWFPIEN